MKTIALWIFAFQAAALSAERAYCDSAAQRREQFARLVAPGNLVAGRPLRYTPKPNYRLTTDENDPLDLTDGKLDPRNTERIWFDKAAVCWQGSPLVTIFADFDRPQPVAAVVVRLLGGRSQPGLVFPDEIRVLASHDGRDYYLAGTRHKRGPDDLSADAWELPEEGTAWIHNFRIPVECTARHLAVEIRAQRQFICSDELAVVRGPEGLPALRTSEDRRVVLVTDGVAFASHHARHPICANMPLRTKVSVLDARSGKAFGGPAKLLLDLPDTVRFVTAEFAPQPVKHEGRAFGRYAIPCNRGKLAEFYLQSRLPAGRTDTLYMYGDSGAGPANQRRITWESIVIPPARQPKRLHVSLAWSYSENLWTAWPDYLENFKRLGFNCVGCFPRYWKEADLARNQAILQSAREAGFKVIVNESPAGALESDRRQEETRSQLGARQSEHVCPAYRGPCYQKEHQSFAEHAVWCQPDYVFFDIEAYWGGSREAPRCARCKQRFAEGRFADWDAFCAALGREIHADMRQRIDRALATAGIRRKITYGSYRTEPATPLNDGLFAWNNLYPDLLQVAMPSLYVAGDAMTVATRTAANRAMLKTNDLIPWLSTGTYGEYEPVRTRDMILEALANGSRGVTYYYYANFDPLHFKYHAEAIDLVAPVEDIFVDGAPLAGLAADRAQIKVCGMGVGEERVVLVSNYARLAPGTKVRITLPPAGPAEIWDLHAKRKIGPLAPGAALEITLDDIAAHLYYVGRKYAACISQQP